MEKVLLAFFFLSGFLVSRLIVKARVPDRLVFQLVGRREVPLSRILFYLVASAAFLSIFIPNVLTVLTILPVIALLRRPLAATLPGAAATLPTMLALALIYGANIGGMGSITATPANGILVAFLALQPVPGDAAVTFESWLLWGLPLVTLMVIAAWGVLALGFRPDRFPRASAAGFEADRPAHPLHPAALRLTALFFGSSIAFSLWMQKTAAPRLVLGIAAAFTLAFVAYLLLGRVRPAPDAPALRLLKLSDCWSELPVRGIAFVIVFTAFTGVLALFGLHTQLVRALTAGVAPDLPAFPVFLGLALLTSFTTEILSNTVVQIALFTVTTPLTESLGLPALPALILITLSSTCAFMSPAATGVNALAFGEIRDVSLGKMMLVGSLMNVVGALVIAGWTALVVGRLYGV